VGAARLDADGAHPLGARVILQDPASTQLIIVSLSIIAKKRTNFPNTIPSLGGTVVTVPQVLGVFCMLALITVGISLNSFKRRKG
jgi:hypothetical protein